MLRKVLVACLTLGSVLVSFATTSFAIGGGDEPRLRPTLPAAELPTLRLSSTEATRINNIIGPIGSTAGISSESFSSVRLLVQTRIGPLYLIPGSHGACLSLTSVAACGDPGGSSRLNALVTLDHSGQTLVGGGIADASVRRVEVVVTATGARSSFPVREGVFAVTLDVPGFKPGQGIAFIAH